MSQKNNFIRAIPGFLDTIEKISQSGFFTEIQSIVQSKSSSNSKNDGILGITIKGTGYIPENKVFLKKGINSLVDINDIIEKTKKMISEDGIKIKSYTFESKTFDWNKYDRSGDKIIGKKGTQTNFCLMITFK